ncbi:hypothetical protein SDC9_183110 [bioreactor metagenome]|uniref:Uncharacterized protein n=1 Tax=bioreactor metagenome TaxID=1076179 RepID=A0A645HB68_9ZZZZ
MEPYTIFAAQDPLPGPRFKGQRDGYYERPVWRGEGYGRLDKADDRFQSTADHGVAAQRRGEGRRRGLGLGRMRRPIYRRDSRACQLSHLKSQQQEESRKHECRAQ